MLSQQLENASVIDIGRLGVPVALFAFDENCNTGMQLSDLRVFMTLEHRPPEVSRRQGVADDQREEAVISLAQIENLDRMLAEDFGRGKAFPQGSRRDETFQALDAFAFISRDALTGASRRMARVLRANELR